MGRSDKDLELNELKKAAIRSISIAVLCFILAGILYYIFIRLTGLSLHCIIYDITGFKCPGCGSTTMFLHLAKFEFKEAFKANWYMICCGPLIVSDIIYIAYKDLIKQKTGIKNHLFSAILIGIGVIFCIIRNI